jgi:hypothetical protein
MKHEHFIISLMIWFIFRQAFSKFIHFQQNLFLTGFLYKKILSHLWFYVPEAWTGGGGGYQYKDIREGFRTSSSNWAATWCIFHPVALWATLLSLAISCNDGFFSSKKRVYILLVVAMYLKALKTTIFIRSFLQIPTFIENLNAVWAC